ncbi:unannotated protein [freshwater metagenome]|uniref:Unannotated protein n=1 Tax=freshwater metagenome TaxID=449393 RepID=A0A6J6WZJ9_9ZZZZ
MHKIRMLEFQTFEQLITSTQFHQIANQYFLEMNPSSDEFVELIVGTQQSWFIVRNALVLGSVDIFLLTLLQLHFMKLVLITSSVEKIILAEEIKFISKDMQALECTHVHLWKAASRNIRWMALGKKFLMKVAGCLLILIHDSCQIFGSSQQFPWGLVQLMQFIKRALIDTYKTVESKIQAINVSGHFLVTARWMKSKVSVRSVLLHVKV